MSSVRTVICVVFVAFVALLVGQHQSCYNAYECVGTEWTLLSDQRIYGSGYKSLSGINTSVNGGEYVHCSGAFACTQISFILSDYRIWCFGSHSCANIGGSSYIKAPSSFYCRGANACENSNMISNYEIYCSGDQSCIHSNITSPIVYARGSYSLYGSTIYANNKVYLYGYQAGYGSTIKCIGNTCNIYCYGNGCEMALICPENSNCNIILKNNDPTITIPPIQNINDYNYDFYDMKYKSNILTLNNEYACNNATQFVYDNYNETQQIIDMNQQNGGPVCCRGSSSCRDAGSITFTATTSDILVCSGDWSCEGNIINTSNPVFCEGYYSCESSTINRADEIYCLGSYACEYSVIKKSTNVYCSGVSACRYANIYSNRNDTNIYLLGYGSGQSTNIYCDNGIKCEITCGGYQSCLSNTVLHCNNNCNVYCNTDTGCPNGEYTIIMPTSSPTRIPSNNPSVSPSKTPTTNPSINPSVSPTNNPTKYPTTSPTKTTNHPTLFPTRPPTSNPSISPTDSANSPSTNPNFLSKTNPTSSLPNNSSISPTAKKLPAIETKTAVFGNLSISLFIIICTLGCIGLITFIYCIYYIFSQLSHRTKEPHNAKWFDAIKQFRFADYICVILEIFDIITDYIFATDLILYPSTNSFLNSFGWISLIISIIGVIVFFSKYLLLKKLFGVQIKKLRKELKEINNNEKRIETMKEIRIRLMDINIISLLNSSVEDIPQTIIVIIYLNHFGFSYISIANLSMSLLSIFMKLQSIIITKIGCDDVSDDVQNIDTVTSQLEMQHTLHVQTL